MTLNSNYYDGFSISGYDNFNNYDNFNDYDIFNDYD